MPERLAPLLAPCEDSTPVERAAVDGILAGFGPETFVSTVFYRPDGGCRTYYAWTEGGTELGDRIDALALAAGLDAADNFHITDLHAQTAHRGRIKIDAHPLRPILADVQAGVRSPEDRRAFLRRVIECAAEQTEQTPRPGIPRWLGVGPALLNRKDSAR